MADQPSVLIRMNARWDNLVARLSLGLRHLRCRLINPGMARRRLSCLALGGKMFLVEID